MAINRRKFIHLALGASASLALPLEYIPGFRDTRAGSRKRRHLINLVGSGGWDSSWTQNAFSEGDLTRISDQSKTFVSRSLSGFEFDKSNRAYLYTQKCRDSSESDFLAHPGTSQLLGPIMKLVFQDVNELKSLDQGGLGVLIWRGLNPAASHEIGNNFILQGNSSSYALSFSALISEALAETSRRPLHYVLMASDPHSLFTNSAMNHGMQIPICIPDSDQFKSLTELSRYETANLELREMLHKTVTALGEGGLRNGVTEKASKLTAGTFMDNFSGAIQIYGSNLLDEREFRWLFKYYALAVCDVFARAGADANFQARGSLHSFGHFTTYTALLQQIGQIGSKLHPLPPLSEYLSRAAGQPNLHFDVDDIKKSDIFANITTSPYTSTYWSSGGLGAGPILKQVFNYALADFLVRRNYSAVVDVPAWQGMMDAHGGAVGSHMDEALNLLRTFALYRALLKSLQSTSTEEGGTLLDATMVALHSEFDRLPFHEARAYSNAPTHSGTNHGNTASLLLAGYGVQGGRIVGEMHHGPSVHAAYGDRYLGPMPINRRTGLIETGGEILSTFHIMPTIMGAFGVRIPLQQVTEFEAIEAVLRS